MENIKEYLKNYIGQDFEFALLDGRKVISKCSHLDLFNLEIGEIMDCKPILKKLSDMTKEDAEAIIRMKWPKSYLSSPIKEIKISSFAMEGLIYSELYSDWHQVVVLYESLNPAQFHYLLSKGYWLWDEKAFTSGLILDSKNVKY